MPTTWKPDLFVTNIAQLYAGTAHAGRRAYATPIWTDLSPLSSVTWTPITIPG